jgi:hypothetical protein
MILTIGADFRISGTSTKVLTMGAATLNLGSNTFYLVSGSSNCTINVGTSTVNCGGIWNEGSSIVSLYDANCTLPYSYYPRLSGAIFMSLRRFSSFHDLNITQSVVAVSYMWQRILAIDLDRNITVSGTLTLSGLGGDKRIFLYSNEPGTQRTITVATISLANADFLDIVGAGVASPFTGTSLGDGGNNSGITFTAAVTRYWVGDGGSWSDYTNHWATTSEGAPGASLPLPQDDVVFDLKSFSTGSQTVVVDFPYLGGDIDWTGVTNNPSWQIYRDEATPYLARYILIFGDLTLDAGMSITAGNTSGDTTFLDFIGRSGASITTNGVNLCGTADDGMSYAEIDSGGGTITLQDTLNCWNLTIRSGTLETNDQDLNLCFFNIGKYSLYDSDDYYTTVNMGNGTWTFNGSATRTSIGIRWTTISAMKITINRENSVIEANTSNLAVTFYFAMSSLLGNVYSPVFNDVIVHGLGTDSAGAVFDLRTTRSFTIANLTILDARILVQWRSSTAGSPTTYTISGTLDAKGEVTKMIYFESSTTTSRAKVSAAVVNLAYIDVRWNDADGVASPFDATAYCIDSGNNLDWNFEPTIKNVCWF